MTTANDRQEGGDHYQGSEYQHWDWVTDAELPYLIGNATKYVSRWRKKNGVQDLKKALHYIDKAEERGANAGSRGGLATFTAQLNAADANIVRQIIFGNYDYARALIRDLVTTKE